MCTTQKAIISQQQGLSTGFVDFGSGLDVLTRLRSYLWADSPCQGKALWTEKPFLCRKKICWHSAKGNLAPHMKSLVSPPQALSIWSSTHLHGTRYTCQQPNHFCHVSWPSDFHSPHERDLEAEEGMMETDCRHWFESRYSKTWAKLVEK